MANQENLRRFLVERLLELDPTLEDAPGSPIYRSVIDPLLARLGTDPYPINIEAFISARMKEDPLLRGLDIDTEGSAFKDILARALIIMLEPLQREGRHLSNMQSFLALDALTTEEADSLLANLLVTRNTGDVSYGTVRVYFNSVRPVSVDASIVFFTASGVQFVPSEPQTKTAADFAREGSLFYVEFDVQSVVAHSGTRVQKDTIKFVTGLSNVVRVTNPQGMTGGVTAQTKDEAFQIAEDAVSERSLNNTRGIRQTLTSNFPDLVSVFVVGYRDPFMQRDKLVGVVEVDTTDVPGEVLTTNSAVVGWNLVTGGGAGNPETRDPDPASHITSWATIDQIFWTNVVAFNYGNNTKFLEAWNSLGTAQYLRVYVTTGEFHEKHTGRIRTIKSFSALDSSGTPVSEGNPTATQIRFVLNDFSIQAEGNSAITVPHTNEYTRQGDTFKLTVDDGAGNVNWRGAPLPFTDVVTLNSSLASYSAVPGKDWLIVKGRAAGSGNTVNQFRSYPIRRKLTDTAVQIDRTDAYMCVRSKLGGTVEWVPEKEKMLLDDPITVRAYGAPGLLNPSVYHSVVMPGFDGVTTVPNGLTGHGGVALFIPTTHPSPTHAWVRLAPHASRPGGWSDYGVEVGDFISLALMSTDTTSGNTTARDFDWWQWARVVAIGSPEAAVDYHYIKVAGIVQGDLVASGVVGFGSAPVTLFSTEVCNTFDTGNLYTLHWTLYKSEVEVVLPNGNLTLTYPDFGYAPAYNTSGIDSGQLNNAETYIPFVNGPPLTVSATEYAQPYFAYNTAINATDNGSTYDNGHSWAIFRLEKDWLTTKNDDDRLFLSDYSHAEIVPISTDLNTLGKYQDTVADGGDFVFYSPVTNPFSHREWQWDDLGDSTTLTYQSAPNIPGIRGFTLSKDLGTSGLSGAMGQVLGPAPVVVTDTRLTLSGVVGGYPFTEEFGLPLTVKDNEVHIGGCVDAYVKSSGVDRATASFGLSSDHIVITDSTSDVVADVFDGTVNLAQPATLYSSDLFADFTSSTISQLWNHAVEVVNCPGDSTLNGKTFRIVGWSYPSSFLQVASDINTAGIDLTSIHFRVVQYITCDLGEPHKVIQRGSDLSIPPGSDTVTSAASWPWSNELVSSAHLEILSGDNKGEYDILSKSGTTATLDTVLTFPETNVDFRVYTKASGVDYPLVRVRSISLSSDDGAGIPIPYRLAVDAVAESFSGLNNDPVVHTSNDLVLRSAGFYDGTGGTLNPAHAAGTYEYAQLFFATAGSDWTTLGIIANDVVELVGQTTDEDTYYWVRSVTANVLVLDRDITLNKTMLNGSIGKPSLGAVRLYFLEPTYVEVGPNTVVKSLDESLSLRPSPAERADVYSSSKFSTSTTLTPADTTTATLTSTLDNWQRLGFKAGDRIEISKKVLVGTVVTTPSDLSAINTKVLVIAINSVEYPITFVSASTLTLDAVVQQINDKVGGFLRAEKTATDQLELYSTDTLEIRDSSSGVLSALGLSVGSTNEYSTANALIVCSAGEPSYDPSTGVASVTITTTSTTPFVLPTAEKVFIDVYRQEYQIVFPALMPQGDDGLYYFDIACTSRSPLSTQRLSENTQVRVSGYDSLGYEFITENSNHTFSKAEKTAIRVTPTVLPSYATNFTTSFLTAESDIDVNYDRSQLVEDVQAFMLNDFNRVVDSNPLARHFLPGYLYLAVRVESGKTNEQLEAEIAQFVSTLYPNEVLEPFDIERVLMQSGVTGVEHPFTMFYVVHNEDRTVTVVRDSNALVLTDERYHIMEDTDNIIVLSR